MVWLIKLSGYHKVLAFKYLICMLLIVSTPAVYSLLLSEDENSNFTCIAQSAPQEKLIKNTSKSCSYT